MKNLLSCVSKANNHLLKELCIDDALNFCISDIGLGQNIDRCYIFKNRIENGVLKLFYSYEWCNTDVDTYIGNPDLSGISYDDLPGLFSILSRDEPMFGLVKDSDNKLFKNVMEMQGIKSYLFTPIFSSNSFWGWIGYDDCRTERIWLGEEVDALHTISKNIGLRLNQDKTVFKLKTTLEKFDYYMHSSNQAMWELDIENTKAVISYNWAGMLGFENDDIKDVYDFWKKSIHPDDKEQILNDLENFIARKLNIYEGVTRLLHKDGYYVWVKYSGLLEENSDGKPIKIIGTHIDITELKEKEHQLKLSEEKFRFIAENSKDVICQHGIEGNFLYVSISSFEIFGYKSEELIHKMPLDFIHKNDLPNIENYFKAISRNQQNGVITFRFRSKNGIYIWLETTTKVIVDSENNVIGFQTSSRDISERINANKEINAALVKERKFNELKSKFVSMASHQFRTPLTVIYSNSELLELKIGHLEKKINNDFTSITTRIKNEVDRMTALMDNILIFGKYESKRIERKIHPICFIEFIELLIKTYFDNNNINRKIEVQIKGERKKIFTDETLITHIFTNLISNAFKYSVGKEKPLLLITYLKSEIQIEVTDYGIGIPQNEIKHLFTSFFRASNTTTIIGSGLGLVIVKQFTEFLNGAIELKSIENYGTTIKLTFPYEQ
ncbi:MAG: PAS domain S-box protein [Flavobacterium sp.]|nr:PAS domain S-box protein [Flavobacterium sp.]